MALGFFWATACLGLFLTVLAADIMGLFTRRNHFDVEGKTVVITGGSQGMGRGLAKLLAQKGANIIIVARNEQKLSDALKYITPFLKSPSTQRLHAISADLTSAAENTRLLTEVTAWNHNHPPDIVWANAGSAHPDLFIDTPLETLHAQMDINYWAAAYLAHATLKAWTQPSTASNDSASPEPKTPAASDRHFLLTSSVAAFTGLAGYAPYAPAKAALRSLADTLRSEVQLYNGARRSANPTIAAAAPPADMHIHAVFPGTIDSPGLANEELTKHPVTRVLEEGDAVQSEDAVAKGAVEMLEQGGVVVATQWLGKAMRAGMLGGSVRDGWGVWDTVSAWVVAVVWVFAGPDLERKVWRFGREKGVKGV